MKKLFIISSAVVLWAHANISVEQIEDMVAKIHEKRKGVDLTVLERTKEPFVTQQEEDNVTVLVKPVAVQKEVKLALHAIMNGKAYINDSWKRVDEKILGYTLKYVGKRGVVLQNGNQIKKLFLHKNRNKLIKIAEGE